VRLVDFVATKFCAECPLGYAPTRFTRIHGAMESQRRVRVYSCRRQPEPSRSPTAIS
jgi:hypothetical protein